MNWKYHKAECKMIQKAWIDYEKELEAKKTLGPLPNESQAWRIRADKAISTLTDIVSRQGAGLFSDYVDRSSDGKGCLFAIFDTPEECEDFAVKLVQYTHAMSTDLMFFKALYCKWPHQSDRLGASGLTLDRCTLRSIDFVTQHYAPDQEAVIFFVVKKMRGSQDSIMANGSKFSFSGTGNVNQLSKRTPKEEKCSQAVAKLHSDIAGSKKYRECRQAMLDLQKICLAAYPSASGRRKGGIFVLRNIFNPKNHMFELNDLKSVNPKLLLKAIRKTLNGGQLSWDRPVNFVFLDDPEQMKGLETYDKVSSATATSVASQFSRLRTMISARLGGGGGVSEDEVMKTHIFFVTGAYLDPDDDRFIYQCGFSDVAATYSGTYINAA
jgi:hypothetical protein